MQRRDYAFPFRIDPASGQAQQTNYEDHVRHMIRQVLLTAPGERADLPEFGCGVRQLLFAPHSEALDASAKIIIFQSLERWLSTHIKANNVTVTAGEDGAQLLILIEYTLIETQTAKSTEIRVI